MGVQGVLKTGENILAIHGITMRLEERDFLVNPVIQAELIASPFFSLFGALRFGA